MSTRILRGALPPRFTQLSRGAQAVRLDADQLLVMPAPAAPVVHVPTIGVDLIEEADEVLVIATGISPADHITLEDGSTLRLEDGGRILTED